MAIKDMIDELFQFTPVSRNLIKFKEAVSRMGCYEN